MRRYEKDALIKVEPWTVIAAVIIVIIAGLMVFRIGESYQMRSGMMNQSVMADRMEMMKESMDQLTVTIEHVEAGLEASEISGLHSHLGLALDSIDGENGLIARMQMMQNAMADSDAHMMKMSSEHHSQMIFAMRSVQQSLQSAQSHLNEAVASQNFDESLHHAQLGLDELRSAMGMSNGHDSVQGGMMFMHEQMQMMMGQMDHSH